jgi:hypothetical protein
MAYNRIWDRRDSGDRVRTCADRSGPDHLGEDAEIQCEVTCKQPTSYSDTAAVLFEWANEAVPGLPAYTVPA